MSEESFGLRDVPIEDGSEETLGLKEYAQALIAFVRKCDTPMTIALQGDWGSGKTSLMNIIRKDVLGDDSIRDVWFNTWQYSQFQMSETLTLSMISYFVDCVVKKDSERARTLKQTAQRLGWGLLKTTAGALTGGVGKEVMENIEESRSLSLDSASEVRRLKDNLQSAVLEEKASRIVVFIDDLDRLIPKRAVELLEGLKLFLDLPKCVFILACDYQVVMQGLKEKFGVSDAELKGKSFFDKIIQVPFNMPLTQYQVNQYFESLLNKINVEYDHKDIQIYISLVNYSVGFNPRSMKRLFNSLLLLELVADNKSIYSEVAANTKRSELSKTLFAILCMQSAYEPVYKYLSGSGTILSDDLFEKLRDEQNLMVDPEFEFLRNELHAQKDHSFYRKLGRFMEAFYQSIQLSSDIDEDVDADERLTEDEINSLRRIMNFSSVVSTESADIEIDYSERYKNRDMGKLFLDELNSRYHYVLTPIEDMLYRKGFYFWQGKSTDNVDVEVNLYSNKLDLGLRMVFKPNEIAWGIQTWHKKSLLFAVEWAKNNLLQSYPTMIIEDTKHWWLAQILVEPTSSELTWEDRVVLFKEKSLKILDQFIPIFASGHNASGVSPTP